MRKRFDPTSDFSPVPSLQLSRTLKILNAAKIGNVVPCPHCGVVLIVARKLVANTQWRKSHYHLFEASALVVNYTRIQIQIQSGEKVITISLRPRPRLSTVSRSTVGQLRSTLTMMVMVVVMITLMMMMIIMVMMVLLMVIMVMMMVVMVIVMMMVMVMVMMVHLKARPGAILCCKENGCVALHCASYHLHFIIV